MPDAVKSRSLDECEREEQSDRRGSPLVLLNQLPLSPWQLVSMPATATQNHWPGKALPIGPAPRTTGGTAAAATSICLTIHTTQQHLSVHFGCPDLPWGGAGGVSEVSLYLLLST